MLCFFYGLNQFDDILIAQTLCKHIAEMEVVQSIELQNKFNMGP